MLAIPKQRDYKIPLTLIAFSLVIVNAALIGIDIHQRVQSDSGTSEIASESVENPDKETSNKPTDQPVDPKKDDSSSPQENTNTEPEQVSPEPPSDSPTPSTPLVASPDEGSDDSQPLPLTPGRGGGSPEVESDDISDPSDQQQGPTAATATTSSGGTSSTPLMTQDAEGGSPSPKGFSQP